MMISRSLWFTLLLGGQVVAQNPPPEILRAEIQELKSVVETLRTENRTLKNENEQLVTHVLNLGNQIRALQAQLDESTPATEAASETEAPVREESRPKSSLHPILSVNVNWHYLILQAGTESGIRTGDNGSVIRDGTIIASVKVTHSKPRQSVAQIDLNSLTGEGIYPGKEDKVRFP